VPITKHPNHHNLAILLFDNNNDSGDVRFRFRLYDSLGVDFALSACSFVSDSIKSILSNIGGACAVVRPSMMNGDVLEKVNRYFHQVTVRSFDDEDMLMRNIRKPYHGAAVLRHQVDGFNCGIFVIIAVVCITRTLSSVLLQSVDPDIVVGLFIKADLFARFGGVGGNVIKRIRSRIYNLLNATHRKAFSQWKVDNNIQ
jgi:hypothetical protein